MLSLTDAAQRFLSRRRIAVAGVSRTPQGHGANVVYQRLRQRGYDVFPVNPNAEEVEGDRCYPDLRSIPGGVEAVVIGTAPAAAEGLVRECVDLGVTDVWMHRSFGGGSVSSSAARYGREHGVMVIEGGCPLMFEPTGDGPHRFLKFVCTLAGTVPRTVEEISPAAPASG